VSDDVMEFRQCKMIALLETADDTHDDLPIVSHQGDGFCLGALVNADDGGMQRIVRFNLRWLVRQSSLDTCQMAGKTECVIKVFDGSVGADEIVGVCRIADERLCGHAGKRHHHVNVIAAL
jgi:hypothetical protein